MDNPERRSMYGLLGGNSDIHSIFGISCSFKNLERPFGICSLCHNLLQTYSGSKKWHCEPPRPNCNRCHGFSLDDLLERGCYKEPIFEPQSDIAEEDYPGNNLFKRPGRLTNQILIDAFIFAREKLLSGELNQGEMIAYLKVLAYNEKTIDKLIKYKNSQTSYDNLEGNSSEDDASHCSQVSERLGLPQPPILLRICPLSQSPETVMHLTMNCIKAMLQLSISWSKVCEGITFKRFQKESHEYLRSIQSLRLNSFQALPFKSDKFGGYVAENYRAAPLSK